jgi:heme-degrading monooxygenase HmoA
MFVQVVRCRVKPGAWPQVEAWLRRWQAEEAPSSVGYKGEYLLREQDDPAGCLFIALFETAEAAQRASDSPSTTAYYQELLTLLEAEPTFTNTDVVHHYLL